MNGYNKIGSINKDWFCVKKSTVIEYIKSIKNEAKFN